ncbi:uncharacterized protein LOC100378907 [Saccoglossus kowalevskii]
MADLVDKLPAWEIQRRSASYRYVAAEEDTAWNTIESRKANGRNMYYDLYQWKMGQSPDNVRRFCSPDIKKDEREELIEWIRDVDDSGSCQSLQILFSFSVPFPVALDFIVGLEDPIVSMGAGCGYWEYLLKKRGVDIVCYDQNSQYAPDMRYIEIKDGGPEVLSEYSERTLMISWPDSEESSTFSTDCLKHYKGSSIIHIGELFGETMSSNPWGQSTSQNFQLQLGEEYRCINRVQLPNWPGHMDALTLWRRVESPVDCDGAMFQHVDVPPKRYY